MKQSKILPGKMYGESLFILVGIGWSFFPINCYNSEFIDSWRVSNLGEFRLYPVLYDNWLFLNPFLFPPKKEMENEVAKPIQTIFFQDAFEIHPNLG